MNLNTDFHPKKQIKRIFQILHLPIRVNNRDPDLKIEFLFSGDFIVSVTQKDYTLFVSKFYAAKPIWNSAIIKSW